MSRIYNFASGPAVLPEPVLLQAQLELLDWQGRGYSVMETSHRSPEFVAVMQETEALLRTLLQVPAHYRILFMQGGGHQQFAMVPINLLGPKFHADYIVTGHWSRAAAEEARRFCNVAEAADTVAAGCRHVPAQVELQLDNLIDRNRGFRDLAVGLLPQRKERLGFGLDVLIAQPRHTFGLGRRSPHHCSSFCILLACADSAFNWSAVKPFAARNN